MTPEVIIAGFPEEAVLRAPALVLADPISFWGGVSATDGKLTDPRSPQHNRSIAGTALFIRELRRTYFQALWHKSMVHISI